MLLWRTILLEDIMGDGNKVGATRSNPLEADGTNAEVDATRERAKSVALEYCIVLCLLVPRGRHTAKWIGMDDVNQGTAGSVFKRSD